MPTLSELCGTSIVCMTLLFNGCSSETSTESAGNGGMSGGSGTGATGGIGTGGVGGDADAGTGASAGSAGVSGSGGLTSAVPSVHPGDPHYLMRNGKLWYPAGYYPGAGFNMTGSDYNGNHTAYLKAYIDLAAAQGVDLFRIWLNWGNVGDPSGGTWDAYILHPYLRPGPGVAFDGQPKVDVAQFNPAYFTLLEEMVDYAASKDIVVQAMLLDCWHVGYGLNFGFHDRDYFSAQNNVNGLDWSTEAEWLDPNGTIFPHLAAFARRVVDTIGDRQNVIWETCNEKKQGDHSTASATANDAFHQAIAQVIHAREQSNGFPRHLVMPVDLPEHRTVAGHQTPTNGAGGEESIAQMRQRFLTEQRAWNVPLISDNDCCEGEPNAGFIRTKAWAALTAGAHVDVFNNELFKNSVLVNDNTKNGMRWVAATRQFVEDLAVDLAGMQPDDSLASGSAWVLARPGDEYVIYLQNGGSTTVSGLPASLTATWFNPRTAQTSPAGAGPTFGAADSNDWVLHIKKK